MTDKCILWHGATNNKGYGHGWWKNEKGENKYWLAHRRAYFEAKGKIPKGKQVRHRICGNRLCINPHHLALGTQVENEQDKIIHGTARYYAQYAKRGYHGRLLPLQER